MYPVTVWKITGQAANYPSTALTIENINQHKVKEPLRLLLQIQSCNNNQIN